MGLAVIQPGGEGCIHMPNQRRGGFLWFMVPILCGRQIQTGDSLGTETPTTATNVDGSSACLCAWAVEGASGSPQLLENSSFLGLSSLFQSSPLNSLPSGSFVLQDVLWGFLEAVLPTGDMQPVPGLSEQ